MFKTSELAKRYQLQIGDGYRAKNSELCPLKTGLVFARAGNINSGFKFQTADYIASSNLSKVGEKISQTHDVLFTSKGTVGRVAFVLDETPSFVYSPQLSWWRVKDKELIYPRFLYYWMHGREFTHQINAFKGQTDMADCVSLRDQRSMSITLPSLSEQKAIARILGSLDDKIELNQKMNQTLEQIARAIFKSWFIDFNPVRAKMDGQQPVGMDAATAELFPNSFEDSALGKIPKGWKIKPLDEIANFLNGLALQKYPAKENEDSLPVIKIAELRNGITFKSGRANLDIPEKYVINDGDIIFSWSGSLLNRIWCGGIGALNQHLFKVTSEKYPKWFYYQWVNYHLPDFQAIAASKATTMGHIQRHHLKEALVVIPKKEMLLIGNKVMSPLLEKYIQNCIESRTLSSIRDTLLPKLMSGEIRVTEAEKQVENVL